MSKFESSLKKTISRSSHSIESPEFSLSIEKAIEPKNLFLTKATSIPLFQDPAIFRVRERSLSIAYELVESSFEKIDPLFSLLQKEGYSLGYQSSVDNVHLSFVKERVRTLIEKKSLQKQVMQLKRPLMNTKTERLIRRSLKLKARDKIRDVDIQALCLSAFLTPLRQSVGSCFATAPAILVQQEQPSLFFQDLEDLLNIGLLKRTFSGQELSIPLSPTWGLGSLDRPFLYQVGEKTWESTELVEIFDFLNLVNPGWTREKKDEAIQKILLKKLKLDENQVLTLNQILKKLVLFKHGLQEEDVHEAPIEARVSALALHPQNPSHFKQEECQNDLLEVQLHLVQLEDHPLLKSWEYTLASFAESKSNFYKWNLFTSLGLDSKEEHGIAKAIYEYLEETLEKNRGEIERLDQEYEQEFFRVKYLERRLQNIESDQMASWARVEYQNHVNELNRHLNARNDLIDKTNRLSKLLPKLVESFDKLFPRYFQELYDATMQDYSQGIEEDAPAGFRLIYKHGRLDPALWSFLSTQEEFIDALKDFFVLTENEIISKEEFKDFEKEVLEIITLIIGLIQTEEFIEGAFARICKRYQVPLPKKSEFGKLPCKPWSYISGGTLIGLLGNYFKRDTNFQEEQKKIATETELFAFLIETLRNFPEKEIERYQNNPNRSLLMYSPTHSFLFKPGWMPLKGLWDKEVYPFSWIRDEFTLPSANIIKAIEVAPSHARYFLETYTAKNPYLLLWLKENVLWPNYSISLSNFRDLVVQSLYKIPPSIAYPPLSEELIESWIYEFFPLIDTDNLSHGIKLVLAELPVKNEDLSNLHKISQVLLNKRSYSPFLSSLQLFHLLKTIIMIHFEKVHTRENWPLLVLDALRRLRFAMPKPIVFADTNWPYFYFAFMLNPSNSKLELWRVDPIGRTGFPMTSWKKWFQDQNPSLWSILINPNEYQAQDRKVFFNPV